ncbi:hypothetical protein [Pseudoalteromonas denitrificans]|jgi:hypothetical protein|uniref:Uncharacterized protein n=1 Tax=Pseudoalteromonas denitrificans DSM 6059 TaxID=1123010 RepID=A0A1I1TUH5_9GAMM|nr:hypothetical protein [Pseudoalteromonas denitrificans]SFD62242.1 hypothetical protein SAMN02745724_05007 [Pseudoalteromonas denitrificans DSM 6059]
MKPKLNKVKLKNLTQDKKTLPADMTPMVAGGGLWDTKVGCVPTYKICISHNQWCGPTGVC